MTAQAAIVLADGCFGDPRGKVAHGLVRGGERFDVRVVVDHLLAGEDAGKVLDGQHRGIPIVAGVAEALRCAPEAGVAVVGAAPHGGHLDAGLRAALMACAAAGLDLVSGLHDHLCDEPELAGLVAASGASIIDVRRTPPARELRFWDGSVHTVRAERIAVLGTDCIVGKRTTARILTAALRDRGISTEMIYTGQTGWMQGGRYGIIYDALVSDFTSGELEGAILRCANDIDPDVMLIEGQGSMRNPAGPCGSALLLSAAASGVILQHVPQRSHFHGLEHVEACRIPDLSSEIALIAHYGVPVLAVALNISGVRDEDLAGVLAGCRAQCGEVPVVVARDGGIETLLGIVAAHVRPAR